MRKDGIDNEQSPKTKEAVTHPAEIALSPCVPIVAEVVFIEASCAPVTVGVPVKLIIPLTFQIPAVREIDVIFAGVAVVSETAEPEATVALICSPMKPADGAVMAALPL